MFERIERAAVFLAVVIVLTAVGSGLIFLGARASASARGTTYKPTSGDGPTIVVKGTTRGCLGAEDSATLRLVDYTAGTIVYRCVRP